MSRKTKLFKTILAYVAIIALVVISINLNSDSIYLLVILTGAIFIALYFISKLRKSKRINYVSNSDKEKKKIVIFLVVSLLLASVFTYMINGVPALLESAKSDKYGMKDLTETNSLVKALKDIIETENITLAMHGYEHQNPKTGSFEDEFLNLSYEETFDRIENSSEIFEDVGLKPVYFAAPGEEYTDELRDILPLFNLSLSDYKYIEYTWFWRNMTSFDDPRFIQAQEELETRKSEKIIVHIQDFNEFIEKFLGDYFDSTNKTIVLRVDDINPDTPPAKLEELLAFTTKYDNIDLILAVTPRFYSNEQYSSAFIFARVFSWRMFLVLVVFLNIFFLSLSSMHYLDSSRKAKKRVKRRASDLPLISIIIPMFNEGKTVRKTMDHALEQTYRGKIEIIAIDDGSTDGTFDILKEIKRSARGLKYKDRTIKLIRQKNQGKPAALNRGFRESHGKIIVSTDGDSFLAKDSVELISEKFFEDSEVGAVAGFVKVLNEEESWTTRFSQIEYIKEQMLFRGCQSLTGDVVICPGAFFAVKRFALKGNPSTDRTVVEDCDQTCMIRKAGWKIVYEPKAVSITRAPANLRNWWNQRLRWFYGYLQVWNILKKFSIKKPWMIYAYLGYPATILTFLIMGLPLIFTAMFPLPSYFLTDMIVYLLFGISLSLGVYAYVLFVLAPEKIKKSTIPWLLLFPIYELMVMVMRLYLYTMYVRGTGPLMKYGPKYMRALPDGTVKIEKL